MIFVSILRWFAAETSCRYRARSVNSWVSPLFPPPLLLYDPLYWSPARELDWWFASGSVLVLSLPCFLIFSLFTRSVPFFHVHPFPFSRAILRRFSAYSPWISGSCVHGWILNKTSLFSTINRPINRICLPGKYYVNRVLGADLNRWMWVTPHENEGEIMYPWFIPHKFDGRTTNSHSSRIN